MLKSRNKWIVRQSDQTKVDLLTTELNIAPLVASLLVNRGLDSVDSARSFLFARDEFHDPFLLKDMDKATERIREAIGKQEPILIYGDYDADGVSSTTVLLLTLRELGANVDYYIPNRFTEGYGPNEAAFRNAGENGIKLIITVDTGISGNHEAKIAKEIGVDLIITDHHEPGAVLPEALAILHPKLEESVYPFRELAGVGVAFKLAHALLGKAPVHLLQFAAIGTIADLVSLKGENRLIAKRGIDKLKTTDNIGLKAIFKIAGITQASLNEETIGFTIAPRINAVGRLESADLAVQLLITDDPEEAVSLAQEMDAMNKQRQMIVNTITAEAIEEVENHFLDDSNKVLVIGKEGWNAGVIGIVASRLVEKYYRPVIILSFDHEKGLAKGSARSISGFDLYKNLSQCAHLLPHFGGHPMAAGMTLKLEDVAQLRASLNDLAAVQLTEDDFIPVAMLDRSIRIDEIDIDTLDEMNLLAPFGMDNPKPKVLVEGVNMSSLKKIGSDQNHLKILMAKNGSSLDGIGFGLGRLADQISLSSSLSVIGELSINEWNNIRKPQLFIQDLAVTQWQLFDCRGLNRLNKIEENLPREANTYVIFDQEIYDKIGNVLTGDVHLIQTKLAAAALKINDANLVLVDLPATKELLESLIKGKAPARIYTFFYTENSDFFSTMPTRDHFKWYYAFLLKNGSFDLKRSGDDLAKHRGWTRETIEFMSKVFFELEFVTINNGIINLNVQTHKRDLTDSKSYQSKQAHFSLEKELLYSSFQQLKDWFDRMIAESVEFEEAME